MGRTSAIALIFVGACLTMTYAPSVQAAAAGASKAHSRATRPLTYRWTKWDVGLSDWNEQSHLVRASDGKTYRMASNIWTLNVGRNWFWNKDKRWGWFFSGHGFIGQGASESRDSSLDYEKADDLVYGAHAQAGLNWMVLWPHTWLGAEVTGMWRHFSRTQPPGYSFGKDMQRFLYMGGFEFSMPVANRVYLVQQLAFSLKGSETFWFIGIRR